MVVYNDFNSEVADLVRMKKVGVVPTDTIYGVIGSALDCGVVKKIYEIKNRDESKPVIVLVGSEDQIRRNFNIDVPEKVSRIWPVKLSVILDCEKYPHIHRGSKKIAFRIPDNCRLVEFLLRVGPIVAPSANPQGLRPAQSIREAKNYFGERVDFYLDGGFKKSKASTVIEWKKEGFEVVREGAVNSKFLR